MNRFNEPWYQDFGTDFGLGDTNGEADEWMTSLADPTPEGELSLANTSIGPSTIMSFMPQSSASPQDLDANTWLPSPYQATCHGEDTDLFSILADAGSQAAANAPLSFHNRIRRTNMPYPQPKLEPTSEDIHIEDLPNNHRADSGIGNFDDLSDFQNSTQNSPWIFDQAAYDGRFEDEYLQTDHTEEHIDETHHTRSLQYHLITTKSRTNIRTHHPDESKKSEVEVCSLCPNKRYTGVWAHRNLMRHMETMHAPCASSNGLKQIICSFSGCERTFRREDARLVHERRSHPELNRAPAAKRKRSDDL